jgi:hypothetical protein
MKKQVKKGLIVVAILAIGLSANAQIGKALLSKIKPNKHLEDQGITNPTHEKYVNQIVWSNNRIKLENPDESSFKTKFNADEKIYGRFYLSESMQNFIYKQKKQEIDSYSFYFDVYVDGVKQDDMFEFTNIGYDYCKVTTWQMLIHVPREKEDFGSSAMWVKMANKNMTPGEHTVKFDLRVKDYDGVVVSGSLVYVKGNEKVKHGWNLDSYTTDGMKDAALEAEILKSIQNHSTKVGWKEKFSRVKIASSDWTIITKEYTGVIVGRSVQAYCLATWPDGNCTVQPFWFTQQYNGSGYSKSFYLDGSGKQEPADCD